MLYVIPKRETLEPDAFLHILQYIEIWVWIHHCIGSTKKLLYCTIQAGWEPQMVTKTVKVMWIQMPKSTKESRLKRLQLNPNLDGNWGR